jgi:3',5'-cyclic-nucleotide phosphodiesterase
MKHIAKMTVALALGSHLMSASAGFEVIALGVDGGISTNNLTSYLLRGDGQQKFLVLDAGATLPGIDKALQKNSFGPISAATAQPYSVRGYVFRNLLDSYFISHGHLDHFAGLVIGSPDDAKKTVYGSVATIGMLSQYSFNWKTWPNLTDAGDAPRLGVYHLQGEPAGTPFALGGTGLTGTLFPLSHGGAPSSMLMVTYQGQSFAYFGDTGADSVEHSANLAAIWSALGDQVRTKSLRGMIIETSFPNEVPDNKLYGHLTPALLLKELKELERLSGGSGALRGLSVVVSHIKPSFKPDVDVRAVIKQQLENGNDMGIKFQLLEQGERAAF